MSEIILDRVAYAHNLAQIAAKVGGAERVFLVAKDNSYGHGCRICCEEAAKLGFVRAVTRSATEAAQIADLFDEILVLSHIPRGDEDERFCYAVNDLGYFSRLKRGLKIYIAADTAMHRNGIGASELDEALRLCKQGGFKLRGFFTHFRASDEL
ncbi:alanine racemase, partial [uncultured Campylobacter sp.]|uniref:alanine racemase n=1 Tax=uncultured Campylobacter sp. TaxID=218934 RepID=UPI00260FE3C4